MSENEEEKACCNCDMVEQMHYYVRKFKFNELLETVQNCVNCSVFNPESEKSYYYEGK